MCLWGTHPLTRDITALISLQGASSSHDMLYLMSFPFPFARDEPVPESSLDFLLDDASDIVHCPTNHAADSTRLSSIPSAAAPSSMDVEQLLPATSPGGRGLVPPSGPSASTAGPSAAAAPAPAPVAAPLAPAAPLIRFGQVYSSRCNGPLPVRRFPAPTWVGVLQPPEPPP